ncbi:MAG TPA: SDR family oxidoreductase [Nitrospiria bacterium]|nr:SDR family oxidoreductase [Candidatus Manganitrophaceae bacterium]
MKNLLVTGGAGFVAQALFPRVTSAVWKVRATMRDKKQLDRLPNGVSGIITGDMESVTEWKPLLEGIDVVIHLAARVHQMKTSERDAEEAYQRLNVELTRFLAESAGKAGVKRFVFLSSVKAMGEETPPGGAWDESSPCLPQDPYGQSKYDAEKVLIDISQRTGLEVVILRLPLVYGPGVKANMARLFKIVDQGVPLPLGRVKNTRSLIFIGNLVDAICAVLDHPKAAGQTFLVSDGEDVSTPELIRRISQALDRPARLLPLPTSFLRLAGNLTGRSATVDRLLNSLVVDSTKIRRELDWTPPYSMAQGLRLTAEWFRKTKF